MIRRIPIIVAAILLPLPAAWADTRQPTSRPNVLFIAVDDLRPQLACFGKDFMKTPNFDALATRSVLFERSFCMVPTCGTAEPR